MADGILYVLLAFLLLAWLYTAFGLHDRSLAIWVWLNTNVFYPALVGTALVFWIDRVAKDGMGSLRGDPTGWLGTFVIVLFISSQFLLKRDYERTGDGLVTSLVVDNVESVAMLLSLHFLGFVERHPKIFGIPVGTRQFYVVVIGLCFLWHWDKRKDPRCIPLALRIGLAIVAGVVGFYYGNDFWAAGGMWALLLTYLIWEQTAHYQEPGAAPPAQQAIAPAPITQN